MTTAAQKTATLIFDFDGTIADTFSFYLSILNKLSQKFGFRQIEPDQVEIYRSMDSHRIMELLAIPRIKLPFIVWEARRLLKEGLEHVAPFAGIKETVEEIRKKEILLGIITSNSVRNVHSFLKNYKFPEFDFIYSSLQIWNKSKTLKRVIHHHKLQPQMVFYVGDETRDIEAVREAGVKSIAVTWGYNSSNLLRSFSPDFLISDPREIIGILEDSLHL